MPIEQRPRTISRGKHTLPPQRWRLIVIVTDTPDPGETYLTKDDVTQEFTNSVDLPAGIEFEIGSVEQAAKGS